MFAKLKKKVEESEGSDLHRLANSISSATASIAEKTFSMSSVKSNDNLTSNSQRGSTTSLASLSGASIPNEVDLHQKLEAKWKQRLTEIENEWRAKLIVKEHEREELSKKGTVLTQQKKQLEERLMLLEGYEHKYSEAEERIRRIQNEHLAETLTLKSSLSETEAKIAELITKAQHDSVLVEELQSRCQENKSVELGDGSEELSEEVANLKKKLEDSRLAETVLEMNHREQQAALRQELETERIKAESLTAELAKVTNECGKVAKEAEEANERLMAALKEKDTCLVRNAELSQQLSLCQQQLQRSEKELNEVTAKQDRLLEENRKLNQLLEDAEARDEHSEKTGQLRAQLAELEAAVQEKNKTIKLQQQRLSDMKKTLQKELKNPQSLIPEDNCHATGMSPSTSRKSPATIFPPSSPGPDTSDANMFLEPVNFKYLKHVIFKFLTSREYEAQHLTRAVSTLLKLSPEEDRLLKETLEWKMSWFRAKPDLGSGQKAMYIPPSH